MMKKITFTILILLTLTFSNFAQSNDTTERKNALMEIGSLNGQVISLFKQKNYDEALKIALNVWSVAEKNGLTNDLRVLPSLTNLAEIYLAKDKESEAIGVFQKILEAYRVNKSDTSLSSARINERIAVAYFAKKDYSKAEDFFLEAVALRERSKSAASKETARTYDALGDVYRKRNNYEKAKEYYLKAIELNDRILSKDEKDEREDISAYECFLYHKAYYENDLKSVGKLIKEFKDFRKIPAAADAPVESGIVNGKAINLVKPAYPPNMRGYDGFVLVRVTIDEQGDVISAKATCGILEFVKTVEESARKSKFSPTLINGQPVKVTGVIIYNFVRR